MKPLYSNETRIAFRGKCISYATKAKLIKLSERKCDVSLINQIKRVFLSSTELSYLEGQF